MSFKDGDFTVATQNGPRVPSFPFANYPTPDLLAILYERDMMVLSASLALSIATRTSITNLLTYSEDDDNAAWTKADATVTADSVANPMDGQTTANNLLETATTAEHTIAMAKTIAASAVTFYRVMKSNGRDWARLKITDSAATVKTAFFNLSTGVVGTVSSGATSAIVPITGASGWYLCALTFTSPAAGSATFLAQPSTDGSTVSYAGDITKGLYLFAAQVEQAATWHAYIKTTTAAATGSAPALEYNEAQEGSDPFAFLIREDPEPRMEKIVAHFTRRHGRIPAPQVSYPGSQYIPLPGLTNSYGADSSIAVFTYPLYTDGGVGFYDTGAGAIYTELNTALYGPVKTVGARVAGQATAGTFTLTYGANTTAALAWNASGATIATAINGLASIISAGLTATCTNLLNTSTGGELIIQWTAGSTLTAVTMNAGSLTVTTSTNTSTQISSNVQQDIFLADHVTVTAHGLTTSLDLAVLKDNNGTDAIGILDTGSWGSIDANTLWLPTAGAVSTYLFAGTFKLSFTQGATVLLRTRVTEVFYLPGVTAGIASPADIPVPADLQQPAAFASALLNLTGLQLYRSEGPQPWMDSLIYVLRKVEINIDDV